jgi:hypothetical protein
VSVVVPPSVRAATGARRRALPALCASVLAVPMIALPVVAGPALADASVEAPVEAPEQAAVEPPVVEPPVVEPPVVEPPVVEPPVVEPPVVEPPVVEPPVVEPPVVEPVAHDDEDPDDVGPTPDDAVRPDLVVRVAGPAAGWAGGDGTYTMSVANAATATAPAADFTLVYSVPPGQTVLSVEAPDGSPWACRLGAQATCTWDGELGVGEHAAPVTVLVGHGRRAVGRLTGTAQVSHLDGEVVLADNTATVVTAMESPDLTLAVAAPGQAAAGQAVSMVLSLTNVGPGWASSFTLHGDVSDGVRVDGLSGAGFTCDMAALRCQYDDELAPGLSAAVTLTGVVDAAHAGGPLTTTAQVDQVALVVSALTSVSAAPPPPAAPVAAPPRAASAPAAAAPATPAEARAPLAATPATVPAAEASTQASRTPTAVSGGRPASLPFTDGPATLPFTGVHGGSLLGSGVGLLLWGVVMTVVGRRRTA